MMQSPEHNLISPEAIKLGYEPQRINIRALLIIMAAFVASMVALQALLWWFMSDIEGNDRRMDRPISVLTIKQSPPSPNLQSSIDHDTLEAQDLEDKRREEDQMFARLGWEVDLATHRVTIPRQIVTKVAEDARSRAAGPCVPPTTTGKATNSILPGGIRAADTQPSLEGGRQP